MLNVAEPGNNFKGLSQSDEKAFFRVDLKRFARHTRNMDITKNPTVGTKIRINGTRTVYRVVASGEIGFDVRGPRGGLRSIVRNIHRADDLTMVIMAGYSARSERIESIEVV